MSLKTCVVIAIPLSPFVECFEKYIFGDWEFVKFLCVLIVLDTLTGFWHHWMEHDVSSKAYGMIAKKLIIYSIVLILGHVLSAFTVDGSHIETLAYFRYFGCSALMTREVISIVENCNAIAPGFIPKSIVKRLTGYDNETGVKIKEDGREER